MLQTLRSVISRTFRLVRDAWLIVGVTVAMLAVLEMGSRAILHFRERDKGRPMHDVADAYRDADFVKDLFRDQKGSHAMQFQAYTHYRREPHKSTYVNVGEDLNRRTWAPEKKAGDAAGDAGPAPAAATFDVFVLGGSTVWGTGTRDDYTIPSCIARSLARDHGVASARVTNFGESGYVTTQGIIQVLLELQKGNVPDLVIVYSGVNDTSSTFQNRAAGLPMNAENRRREFNILRKSDRLRSALFTQLLRGAGLTRLLLGQRDSRSYELENEDAPIGKSLELPEADHARLAVANAEIASRNAGILQKIGEAYGFRALFYLQPISHSKRSLTEYEKAAVAPKSYITPFYQVAYREWRARFASVPGFRDLSPLFDGHEGPIYLDFCHLSEQGNELIAKEIVADILALLPSSR